MPHSESGPSKRTRTSLQKSFRLSGGAVGGRAARGAVVTGYSSLIRAGMTIASTAVLARLLVPEQFGLAAMASLVLEMVALLGYFGFGAALVRAPKISRIELDTAFWMSVLVGAVLGGVMLVGSQFFAAALGDARIAPLIATFALLPVLEFAGVVQASVISRRMLFKLDLVIQILHVAVRSLAAIAFAYAGYGVWSLVIAGVLGRATALAVSWVVVPYLPRFRFSSVYLKRSFRFNYQVFWNNLIWYLQANVDYLVVGRLLGPGALGFYQAGYRLADEVKNRLIGPLQKVLFPAFANIKEDVSRRNSAYLRTMKVLAALLAPFGLGMSALSGSIVSVMYGEGWSEAAAVMAWLSPFVVFRAALATPTTALLLAADRVDLAVRLQWISLGLCALCALVGVTGGIEGVALGVGLAGLLWMPLVASVLRRELAIEARRFYGALVPPFGCAVLMFACVATVSAYLERDGYGVASRLSVGVIVGVGTYGASLLLLARAHTEELLLAVRALRR